MLEHHLPMAAAFRIATSCTTYRRCTYEVIREMLAAADPL